jgi:small subunit ribosomal protein S1
MKVGDVHKAKIIGIEGSKIFLSMKQLTDNPWLTVADRYKVGDVVEGTVLKSNPFGFFVELDKDIHGLAHISELDTKPVTDLSSVARIGDRMKFAVVSVEPDKHRLGLSLKALKKKEKKAEAASEAAQAPEAQA